MSTKIRPSAVASIPTPPEKRTLHPVAATKLNTRQRIPKSRYYLVLSPTQAVNERAVDIESSFLNAVLNR